MTRLAIATSLAIALALPIAAQADDSSKQQAFQNQGQTYEMTGTITKAEKDEVTLTRQGLPNAQLDVVAQKTKVSLSGHAISSDQLQPGMEVRAQFQVVGSDVVATQIQAMPAQGSSPGSQGPGSQGSSPGSQPGSQGQGSQGESQGY